MPSFNAMLIGHCLDLAYIDVANERIADEADEIVREV